MVTQDQSCVCKQLGYLSNAPDVLPVHRGEAYVAIQSLSDVIPLQGVAGNAKYSSRATPTVFFPAPDKPLVHSDVVNIDNTSIIQQGLCETL